MNAYIFVGLPASKQRKITKCVGYSIHEVVKATIAVYKVTEDDLRSKSRKRIYTEPRQIAIGVLLNSNKKITLQKVGDYFGGRNHSTIIHNKDVFEDQMITNKYFKAKANQVLNHLKLYN